MISIEGSPVRIAESVLREAYAAGLTDEDIARTMREGVAEHEALTPEQHEILKAESDLIRKHRKAGTMTPDLMREITPNFVYYAQHGKWPFSNEERH